MEVLPIVHPETGELVGRALPRHAAIAERAWCRSTNVYVLNPDGHVLCHRRSTRKERLPGVWTTHLGGHVALGETYESNARKELEEESGIAVAPERLLAWRTVKIEDARLWAREFVTLADLPVSALVPQPGEVEEFRWLPVEDIIRKKNADPDAWCAGTHDIAVEYQCMRAALHLANAIGAIPVPKGLHLWQPGFLAN